MKLLSAEVIRRCLIADPGMVIFTADYDQIELRVIAALANEPTMIAAAKKGQSLHEAAAIRLFGTDYTPDQYKRTKNINFTFAFGGSAWTMTEKYGIPYRESQQLVSDYRESFPALARFAKVEQDKILKNALSTVEYRTYKSLLQRMWNFRNDTDAGKKARKQIQDQMRRLTYGKIGYAWNPFGRRLVVDAEKPYTVVNYLVQSSAADIFKHGFLRVMNDPELEPTVLLPVHDELLGQGPVEQAEWLCKRYAEEMTTEFLGVPITASGKVYGPSWGHGYQRKD